MWSSTPSFYRIIWGEEVSRPVVKYPQKCFSNGHLRWMRPLALGQGGVIKQSRLPPPYVRLIATHEVLSSGCKSRDLLRNNTIGVGGGITGSAGSSQRRDLESSRTRPCKYPPLFVLCGIELPWFSKSIAFNAPPMLVSTPMFVAANIG